tara:strand:- start:270 stop:701 length:432 start_codon:yes stop_codon:yes gene_type:complete
MDLLDLLNKNSLIIREFIKASGYEPSFVEAMETSENSGYFTPSLIGLEFSIGKDHLVDTIHIHSDGHHEFNEYGGSLPEGIILSMSQKEVNHCLDAASRSGGPMLSPLDEFVIYWDKWNRDGYSLHIEYPDDVSRILMVTVSR